MKKLLIHIIALLLMVVCSAAAAADSPLDRFTAEERQKLTKGEAVYRHVKTEGEDGKIHGHGESYAVINAPIDRCWKIFTEFDKHQLYFPRKKKSEVVKSEGNKYWVYKQFEFYVVTVEYTVLYTVDKERRRVDFDMDKSYPHDLEDTAGYFQFEKLDDKRTLFTYAATRVETGLKVPGFIQEYLTSRDLPAVVLNVKKRIESGGKWTKDD
jgi:hypothetical protein